MAVYTRTRGKVVCFAVILALSGGCGEFVRQSRSPSQLVIVRLETPAVEIRELQGGNGVPGSIQEVQGFGVGPLDSDVNRQVRDPGQVVLRQILRDPGAPGTTTEPTPINDVTVMEYEVRYRLANGRNTPGVDVPHPIRGGMTMTIRGANNVTGQFDLVRAVAKAEPPLSQLTSGDRVLSVIADVTFFGRDQAGNAVSVTGSVHINFANFS